MKLDRSKKRQIIRYFQIHLTEFKDFFFTYTDYKHLSRLKKKTKKN